MFYDRKNYSENLIFKTNNIRLKTLVNFKIYERTYLKFIRAFETHAVLQHHCMHLKRARGLGDLKRG